MKSNRQLRKFLYRIVLTGILLSLGFGMGGSTTAQAQQAAVSPNPIYLPLVFRDFSSITKLTLMVYKSGDGSGTVTSSPGGINCGDACSYAFVYNTAVTLTASPTSPSTFGGWDGAGCSGTGTCTVTMSSTQSVTATFNPPGDQTLTVNKSGAGSGTVTSSPTGINCGTTCSYAFAYETAVILTASPTSPSTFSGWNGAGCSGTSTCTVSMSSAQSVTATFNLPGSQTLTVSKSGTGSGTVTSSPAGIDCGSTCSASFNTNASIVLTALASTGSTFTGWSGSGCSGSDTCMLTMDAAKSVTATFILNDYELRIGTSGTGSGTVTSSPTGINCGSTCISYFAYNTFVTLTATPISPSTFVGWTEGACLGTGTCQISMVADQQAVATFNLPNLPCSGIYNCDFEKGRNGQWTEYSALGFDIIYLCSNPFYCNNISPHSGIYLAWFGGTDNETSSIEQQTSIASSAPFLVYWQWIESEDYCNMNYDYAEVLINGTRVDKYDLCMDTRTVEWVPHNIDLSNYAGKSVTLQIRVRTDGSNNSSLYIDDVSLQASPSTLGTILGVAPKQGSTTTHGKNGDGTQR